MHSTQQDSLNLSLYEDQKNYRKLRKILRQIEHLVILPRNLNKEEENKVSKRKFYRDQLEALNLKYKNQSELLTDTNEKEADMSEPSSFLTNEAIEEKHLDTENIHIASTEIEEEKNENESHAEESCQVSKEITVTRKKNKKSKKSKETVDIDELAEKMENIVLESPESQEKKILVPKVDKDKAQSQKLITTEKPKKYIPKISFSTKLIENAHEDLILSIDVCSESNLIVTAGRDTTIKVWNTEGIKLHSFGGHSKSITCLKFWPYKSYVIATENLTNEQNEEIDYPNFEINDDGERETDNSRNKPLVLSSSLDCTFRLWSIYKGVCIKSIYLYNPINNFDVTDTSFLIALEAGKIEYWKDLNKVCETKLFNDSESVSCIKFFKENKKKFFVMASSGNSKICSNDQNQSIACLKNLNLHEILQVTYSKMMNKNFKFVEILDENKIIVINDNQSFIILYDFSMEEATFKLISTNSNNYGFTNYFYKLDDQIFINSYNIDNGSSSINVFKYDTGKELEYQYTLQDKEDSQTYCLSTLVAKKMHGSNHSILVSGTRNALKIWKLCQDDLQMNKIKLLRMCPATLNEVVSSDPESDPENEENEESLKDEETIEKESSTKKSCLLQ